MSGFESLEDRRLMAVLVGTDLQVTGTAGNDVIRVSQNDAATLRVEENGVVSFFNDANVSTIRITGNAGNDRLEVLSTATRPLTENATIVAGDGNDTLVGGSGNDSLDGGNGADAMTGNAGNDLLNGGIGNNSMFGNDGNDTLKASLGADVYDGGAGTDLADYSDRTKALSIALDGVANDGQLVTQIVLGLPKNVNEGDDVRASVEDVTTGSGDDSIIAGTLAVDNVFRGNAGNDKLRGRNGNDRLLGGDGSDILVGGAGNDDVVGNEGDDILSGGTGADRFFGGTGNDVLFSADAAVDGTIDGGDGTDILDSDTGDVFSNVEIHD